MNVAQVKSTFTTNGGGKETLMFEYQPKFGCYGKGEFCSSIGGYRYYIDTAQCDCGQCVRVLWSDRDFADKLEPIIRRNPVAQSIAERVAHRYTGKTTKLERERMVAEEGIKKKARQVNIITM